jgi:hypothetical protein
MDWRYWIAECIEYLAGLCHSTNDFAPNRLLAEEKMEQLCSEFQTGMGLTLHKGRVLLDAENIYMLSESHGLGALDGAGQVFGLVGDVAGGVIEWVAEGVLKSISLPFETTYAELPERIRHDLAWGNVAGESRIIVLPRSAAKSVSCSFLFGCEIKTEKTKFSLRISLFGVRRAQRLFAKYGWKSERL